MVEVAGMVVGIPMVGGEVRTSHLGLATTVGQLSTLLLSAQLHPLVPLTIIREYMQLPSPTTRIIRTKGLGLIRTSIHLHCLHLSLIPSLIPALLVHHRGHNSDYHSFPTPPTTFIHFTHWTLSITDFSGPDQILNGIHKHSKLYLITYLTVVPMFPW